MRPRRFVLDGFASEAECLRLVDVQQALGVPGYRPAFLQSTALDWLAAGAPDALLAVAALRARVLDAVGEAFGVQADVYAEYTGLASWMPGSELPFHFDQNREHLRHRDWAAVVYLNDDFQGGELHFRDEAPADGFAGRVVVPRRGSLVMFTGTEPDMHRVTRVNQGTRFTLTLWLTSDYAKSEDVKMSEIWLPRAPGAGKGEDDEDVRTQAALVAKCAHFHIDVPADAARRPLLVSADGVPVPHAFDAGIATVLRLAAFVRRRYTATLADVVRRGDFDAVLAAWQRHNLALARLLADEALPLWRQVGLTSLEGVDLDALDSP